MSHLSRDPNLVYGMMALQMDFISANELLAAMSTWMMAKERPIGDILLDQNAITPENHHRIMTLVGGSETPNADVPTVPDPGVHRRLPAPSAPSPMRYEILRKHDEGGLGIVHVALDSELSREVALKQMKPELRSHTTSRELFVLEAEVTGRLEHPGIVPVHGFGKDADGHPWYAMRFIRGETLRWHVKKFHQADESAERDAGERAMALRDLLGHFLDVCDAISYAHSRGVIHRDLKPGNVMIGPYRETLVLDWGLAKPMDVVEQPARDRSRLDPDRLRGRVIDNPGAGSPAYMAPEQLDARADLINYRTDVYLLGGILYEILTGQAPHRNGRRPDPPRPKMSAPWVPVALDQIVARAMQPGQAERYQQVNELAEEVRRWLAEEPIAAFRFTVSEFQRRVESRPDNAPLREQWANHLVNLGVVLTGMSRFRDAIVVFRQAIVQYETLTGQYPDEVRYRAILADAKIHLARASRSAGNSEEARRLEQEAIAAYDWLMLSNPQAYDANLASVVLTMAPHVPSRGSPDEETGEFEPLSDAVSDDGTLPPTVSAALPQRQQPAMEMRSRFTIRGELARGGMGSVLVAVDNELNREVIIKQINPAMPEAHLTRFWKEAQITAQLEHPSIIPVYGVGYRSGVERPFLIMRYHRGSTLLERIRRHHEGEHRGDREGLVFLLKAFVKVCEALSFAHSHGVVHRDPKPSNVMVSDAGEVAVLDWGLAKVLGEDEGNLRGDLKLSTWANPGDTAVGTVMGTPAYMAPEMARNADAADERTDIFIAGAVLFEILTGMRPWGSIGNVIEVLRAVLEDDPPPPRSVDPTVPKALDAICQKAMSRDPADRYQQIAILGAAVEHWLTESESSRKSGLLAKLGSLFGR